MRIRNIGLIIQREYKSKVIKKSFWVMAFLGPLFLAIGMIVPMWLGMEHENKNAIQVVDQSGFIADKLISTPEILFVTSSNENEDIKKRSIYYASLVIPFNALDSAYSIKLYSRSRVSPEIMVYIENNINEVIYLEKLKRSGLEKVMATVVKPNVLIKNESLDGNWEKEQSSSARLIAGMFSCVLILFFIIIYCGQVMRGVMEEKTNRIVEVMVATVKPLELMMGKIVGIALVSLTQFLIWVILTSCISFAIQSRYGKVMDAFSNKNLETTIKNNPQLDMNRAMEINEIVAALDSLDIFYMISIFLIYFVFGYLLYAALFAGIGSLVDTESDTQQFVFPIIAPLLFVLVFATAIMDEPHGQMAFWLSMIPFTAPLTMMLRIPYDVPVIQLIVSVVILIISFLGTTWIAAKIYRTGILLYGKKVSVSEIMRALRQG